MDRKLDTIPAGWTRGGWIHRLRRLAHACRPYHPERADELEKAAETFATQAREPYVGPTQPRPKT